jgi:branched-chain amino acid transport system substrate-binding protein
MKGRKLFIGLLGSALAIALVPSMSQTQEGKPIKIGLLLPYKGVYAQEAAATDRGFQVALAEFNGSVAGRKIEIIRADDELTPNVGVQRFNRLIQADEVDLVAGVISSAVGIALSELAEKAKKPLILALSFSDDISGKFCNPYVARTSFSANALQYSTGKYWAEQGRKTAVTVGPDYVAGRQFIDGFKRGFEDNGGKVVGQFWSAFQQTKDWGGILANLKGSNAEIAYGWYAGAEAIQFVKQYAELGLDKTLPLYGDQWLFEETLWDAMGSLVQGKTFSAFYTTEIPTDANKKFVDAYRKMFNKLPDVSEALGYDNGKAILLALQKTKGVIGDGASFIEVLRSIEFEAPRGKIKFVKNDAQLEKVYLVEVQKDSSGKFKQHLVKTIPGSLDLPGCTRL